MRRLVSLAALVLCAPLVWLLLSSRTGNRSGSTQEPPVFTLPGDTESRPMAAASVVARRATRDEEPSQLERISAAHPVGAAPGDADPKVTPGARQAQWISAPASTRAALQEARRLARRLDVRLTDDPLLLPAESWRTVTELHRAYQEKAKALQPEWHEVLDEIREDKYSRGDVEQYRNPDSAPDAATKREWDAIWQAARKPRAKNEVVLIRGAGPRLWIARIQPADHARLFGLQNAYDVAAMEYVTSVSMLLSRGVLDPNPVRR